MEIELLLSENESEEEENREMVIRRRRQRTFRERINFDIQFVDVAFKEKFRIYPEAAECILRTIATDLQHPTRCNQSPSPQEQLLIALHFVGNGAQYHGISDMHGLSKATVCHFVNKVANVIVNKLFGAHVRWPNQNTEKIAEDFHRLAEFPRVAGVVDGSLIPMDAPHINEAAYVDRHGNHSINAMVVAGPQLQFFYASARWPGSVHDARVIRNSSLYHQWHQEGILNFFLIQFNK